jgi:hypothetical protein
MPLAWPPQCVQVGGDYISNQLNDLIGSLIDWEGIPPENQDAFIEDIKVCVLLLLHSSHINQPMYILNSECRSSSVLCATRT